MIEKSKFEKLKNNIPIISDIYDIEVRSVVYWDVGVLKEMSETKTTYYPDGSVNSKFEINGGVKNGSFVSFHENGQKSIETQYDNGNLEGVWKEWYSDGQIAEEGSYSRGEYKPKHFWTRDGEQTLVEGTGKVIRVFGANNHLVVEQYFEQGLYKGEKKLTDIRYGRFTKK